MSIGVKKEKQDKQNNVDREFDGLTVVLVTFLTLAVLTIMLCIIVGIVKSVHRMEYFSDTNYVVGSTITNGYIKDMNSVVDSDGREHYTVVVRGKREDGTIEERTFEVTSVAYNRYNKDDYIEFDEKGVELGKFKSNTEK